MTTKVAGKPAVTAPNVFQEIVDCSRRKGELEKELDHLKVRMGALEKQAIDRFMEMGARSIKTTGGQTVYLQNEVYASLISDKERAHEVLRSHGLDYMIKDSVNGNTLSSWVREQEKEDIPIPPEVEEVLSVRRNTRVKVKSS